MYKSNNYLYKELLNNNIEGKIIKIIMPILFDKKIASSILSESNTFICQTDGKNKDELTNYYKIDNNFPHMILITYIGNISYIPMDSDIGLTFSIKQIKIKKINKIHITDKVFYYMIEGI